MPPSLVVGYESRWDGLVTARRATPAARESTRDERKRGKDVCPASLDLYDAENTHREHTRHCPGDQDEGKGNGRWVRWSGKQPCAGSMPF